MDRIINVILSGGSGTRLWPLSRQSNPKQFLPLFDNGESLFQRTLKRNVDLVSEFLLVTNLTQLQIANKQTEALSLSINKRVVEPVGRNTSAAIAMAALSCDPNDILFVTPSDQMIKADNSYISAVNEAISIAKEGFLATYGIQPRYPETDYGYIEHEGQNVVSFREKPSLGEAERFVNKGGFLWNSGMFCFKSGVFLSELKKYREDIYTMSLQAYETISGNTPSYDVFSKIPDISVDYAVMERSDLVKVVASSFDWSDLGSFRALIDYHLTQETLPRCCKIGGSNYGYAFSNKKVYTLGLDDIVYVETEDCVLIMSLEECKQIKNLYNTVKQGNPSLT